MIARRHLPGSNFRVAGHPPMTENLARSFEVLGGFRGPSLADQMSKRRRRNTFQEFPGLISRLGLDCQHSLVTARHMLLEAASRNLLKNSVVCRNPR
jgi:hypothetical protein